MPNIKSAKKRVKTSERNYQRNLSLRSAMRTAIRAVRDAITANNQAEALAKLPAAFSRIDRAIKRNVVHRNAGARYKARLAAKIKALQA